MSGRTTTGDDMGVRIEVRIGVRIEERRGDDGGKMAR